MYKYTFLYVSLLAIDLTEIYRKERDLHLHYAYIKTKIKITKGGDKVDENNRILTSQEI